MSECMGQSHPRYTKPPVQETRDKGNHAHCPASSLYNEVIKDFPFSEMRGSDEEQSWMFTSVTLQRGNKILRMEDVDV